jgi:OOP family OmpA-OmpF porin
MHKKTALSLIISATACGASLMASSVMAQAITDIKATAPKSAYVQDGRGVIARDPFGLCWRTGYWTPADAVGGCDKELEKPAPKQEAAPPPPPPPPPPAPAPPPAPPKRCDFSATLINDQTFAFNKATLSAAAQKRIDEEVLPKLTGCAKVDFVIITGHTDRLGSQQYNQKLSEKRADTVAAYLKKKGVDANMDTLGVGKTQAIKACDDKLPRKQLIECLTPNRRVVIEAKGPAK